MKNIVLETDGEVVNIPMLEIWNQEDMCCLVNTLSNNGYEVQVTPIYVTQEDIDNKGYRSYRNNNLRIKYYSVKILGFITPPNYENKY